MVAKDEKELDGIFELKRRGDTNGVDLELIDEKDLRNSSQMQGLSIRLYIHQRLL